MRAHALPDVDMDGSVNAATLMSSRRVRRYLRFETVTQTYRLLSRSCAGECTYFTLHFPPFVPGMPRGIVPRVGARGGVRYLRGIGKLRPLVGGVDGRDAAKQGFDASINTRTRCVAARRVPTCVPAPACAVINATRARRFSPPDCSAVTDTGHESTSPA